MATEGRAASEVAAAVLVTICNMAESESNEGKPMTWPVKLNVNVNADSESVVKLAHCVERIIGNWREPASIVAKAEAQAKASIILAQAEIDKHALALRAAKRFARIETRRQENIETIANKAIKELPETVSKEPVSEDWTAHFFDCCQDIGEEEMQTIWGKILAGEVAKPGRFGRRTLQVLKTLSPFEARTFTDFCSAAFTEGMHFRLLFRGDYLKDVLADSSGFNFHLSNIGLLGQPTMSDLWKLDGTRVEYFGRRYCFNMVKHDALPDHIPFPGPPIYLQYFSEVGNELASIATPQEKAGIIDSIEKEWAEHEVKFAPIQEDESEEQAP